MKKFRKLLSVVLTGLIITSTVPAFTVSAAKVSKPKVTVTNEKKGIKISWKKTKGAKKYTVLRKTSGSKKFKAIKTVKKSTLSFLDKNVTSGKKYTYKVQAINGKISVASKQQTMLRLEAPVIEDGVGYECSILWEEVDGAEKYEVYRADIKTISTGAYDMKYKLVDTFVLGTEDDEERYYTVDEENIYASYKVRAVKGKFKGPFSNVIKINYIAPPNYGAWLRKDKSAVDVHFSTVKDAVGYKIYRKEQGGEYELLIDIPASELKKYENKTTFNTHTYVDKDYPDDGKTYYYGMEAYVNRSSVKAGQATW